ncbi:GIY-YIG nuclease family protein [Paraclostridium tenue]|uniref:Zinc ribbon domain-containing protein n=1 Tax=Paraclostridium tenue TaxID=1737 RepID=A0ABP3XB44_9FIRM
MKKNINLIGQFKADWIRYSDYEIKENEKGKKYICPTESSYFTMYNPFDNANELVFDLIKLGDLALDKSIEKSTIENKLIVFAKKYGLLGLIASSVYNRNIIGEEKVLFVENNCIKKEGIMDVDKYLDLFLPFCEEEELYIRKIGKHLTVHKLEDSPKFYGKRPLILDLVFSRFYCEEVDWILDFAKNISTHINQLLIYKNANLTEAVTIMAGKFKAEKIGLTIGVLDKPIIEWEFDSLKTTIETIYAFAVTNENNILTRCEYCKSAFIAKSEREKYCTPSCRNCSNVIKSRNKKKALKNKKANDNKVGDEKMSDKEKRKKEFIMEYKERPVTGGVYKITNTMSGNYLLMNDIDLKSTKNRFDFSVKTDMSMHPKMSKDWKEFGSNSFTFEVLEEIEKKDAQSKESFKEDLKKLEEIWAEKLDSIKRY